MMIRIFNILCILLFFFHQNAFPGEHFKMGLFLGYFHPSQSEFKGIYGNGYPKYFSLSLKIKNNLFISTGYEFINLKGNAIGEGEESYPLRFEMKNLPISIFYIFQLRNLESSIGIGLIRSSFKERWESIPLEYSGRKTGYFVFANLEIPLVRVLYFVTSIRFERIYSDESAFSKRIDLGGFKAFSGISINL
jgi:hypothetical protein